MFANGILLIYHHHLLFSNAPTIMEHVNSFRRHSRFDVWSVNTEIGFPKALEEIQFPIIMLHYSLWNPSKYYLNDTFLNYLAKSDSYKIAFFQDEFHFCKKRFDFINQFKIDCIYTLIEPQYFKDIYQKYTTVSKLVYTIPGYVSDDLLRIGSNLTKPEEKRNIDIGYRGRPLPFYGGRGAQEKTEIAEKFLLHADGLNLRLNIETAENKRIYGKGWYKFVADCLATLGVEAGVSIFDVQDKVRPECERLLALNENMGFDELSEKFLNKWEDNIPYRTVSPRHFEAAALRVCQILYEGDYSGILRPLVHYIPLKKDFSNFDDIIAMFKDAGFRRQLTENAYRGLIASGIYSYQKFIESFDQELIQDGFKPGTSQVDSRRVTALLNSDRMNRKLNGLVRSVIRYPYPYRPEIGAIIKPVIRSAGERNKRLGKWISLYLD